MGKWRSFWVIISIVFSLYGGVFSPSITINAEATIPQNHEMELTAVSAILMEGSTGTILYEKEADREMAPASITKIMTLLLIMEALEMGKIKFEDVVTVSEHAAGKGGSQAYLEAGETQTVEDMIKCISIASANDASAAMAELLAGSEEVFVNNMNQKAKELGMKNTIFKNCTGLDAEGHYSSARDVAIMSKELIMKYPEISRYSTTWMDSIIHKTRRGESEFGLTNTNKLVRTYQGITGLKTGSTSEAKFCLSATATRENCDMIAVVMGCPNPTDRFTEAAKLLNYGFANCKVYEQEMQSEEVLPIPVKKGTKDMIECEQSERFHYLFFLGENPSEVTWEITYVENLEAPISVGDQVGMIHYYYEGDEIGRMPICAVEPVERAGYKYYLNILWSELVGRQDMVFD